ncbi:MAG: class I SAM-dependent methyltransferase, partial [Caulobacteraceae bacterium]
PGLFSWDRIDAGSALLLERLSDCKGRGADLGCGIGVVSRALLESSGVTQLLLIDIDRRAIAMAKRNIDDPRAVFLHADALQPKVLPQDLDFVAINPPRRVGGTADRSLALDLLFAAIRALRPGGRLLTVVERTLACESAIQARVSLLRPATREGGYKLLEAVK